MAPEYAMKGCSTEEKQHQLLAKAGVWLSLQLGNLLASCTSFLDSLFLSFSSFIIIFKVWDSKPLRSFHWTASFNILSGQSGPRQHISWWAMDGFLIFLKYHRRLKEASCLPGLEHGRMSLPQSNPTQIQLKKMQKLWLTDNENMRYTNMLWSCFSCKLPARMSIIWKMMLEYYFDLNVCRFLCECSGSSQHWDEDSSYILEEVEAEETILLFPYCRNIIKVWNKFIYFQIMNYLYNLFIFVWFPYFSNLGREISLVMQQCHSWWKWQFRIDLETGM